MKSLIFLLPFLLFFLLVSAGSNTVNKSTIEKNHPVTFLQDTTEYVSGNYKIKFPKDQQDIFELLEDSIEIFIPEGYPFTLDIDVEIIEVFSQLSCPYLVRSYELIDWYIWDGESEFERIGRDENCNEEDGDEDIWLIVETDSLGNRTVYLDRDSIYNNQNPLVGTNRCEGGVLPTGHWANSDNNPELSNVGYWVYYQIVKVVDTLAPEIILEQQPVVSELDNQCEFVVNFSFRVDETNSFWKSLDSGEIFLDTGNDGVLDEEVEPSAIDSLQPGEYLYTISDTISVGIHSYFIFMEDECHSIDSMTIEVVIEQQNNFPLQGQIMSWDGVLLKDVLVTNSENVKTDETGNYSLCLDSTTSQVLLSPYYNDYASNGLSGMDMIAIGKHILGTQPLDNPYKLIAADVNNSGDITVSDLLEIQSVILQNNTSFSNNTSWRFVDKQFQFPENWNLDSEFPEYINVLNNGTGEVINKDFIGVKIGHVAGGGVNTIGE
ncbi:MAG: hypothetical protein DWQ02_21675 [Bacteroidetes bacterium]|nr:MAG: hypothetical protein DWQ02_21675 [Bacteroidota bacterium]